MTPTQKAAMEMAFEAMGLVGADLICEVSHHKKSERHSTFEACPIQDRWHKAFAALRAALAEQSGSEDKAVPEARFGNMAPLSDDQIKDPCPGCKVGRVCRTPKCGRLALPTDHPLRTGIKGD
jgi:hypothetical protein